MNELERDRLFWRQCASQEGERAEALENEVAVLCARAESNQVTHEATNVADLKNLWNKAVLCVGGRPSIVPSYRQIIECTGVKFLHHDCGEENHVTQLEAHLFAADLVICQTGCVSHDAYWRVKDHCKRTGKRCVFVDKPSASSFARCLRKFGENTGTNMEDKEKDNNVTLGAYAQNR